MRKALLYRFTGVLALALTISSILTYYFVGHQLLRNTIDNLMSTIHVVDYSLNYEKDLQEQLKRLHRISFDERTRITILDKRGTVIADTNTEQPGTLENHLQRAEIQSALQSGKGYSTRFSSTLEINMLYVAEMAESGQYIIRISTPYRGILDYMQIVFPMLILGMGAALLVSVYVTIRFTDTITKPLQKIAEKMQKIHGNELEYEKQSYRYEELNVISDTTEKLTKDLRAYIDKLEFEKKVRQKFFSNASHELKTPITSIKGYAELLEAGFVQDEATKKDFLVRILRETENMTELINDILMISRLETKEAEVTFSTVRMAPLLKEIFESLEPLALEYQVTLHSECDPVSIEASNKQLRELIVNLVSNGIKYNHPGGNVWVEIKKQGRNLSIKVKDDGMGIPKEHKKRVFERFYRVDKGRSKKMGGTGLGLSIVKHIVEFYEGSLELSSKVSQGSTFTVRLPMERNENLVDKTSNLI